MNKRILLIITLIIIFLKGGVGVAQQKQDSISNENSVKKDTVASKKIDTLAHHFKKRILKLDGVSSVVGNYVILDSDINKAKIEFKSQGISLDDFSECALLERLMENKLYAHHAIQDSIEIKDAELKEYVDRQIDYFLQQMNNDMSQLLKFYKKESEKQLRKELLEINRVTQLSQRMQQKITEDIKITPDQVSRFYKDVIKDDPPYFGTEVEISQILIEVKVSEKRIEEVRNKLLQIKEDIEDNEASFASKALLYSEDPGSRARGGMYTISKKTPFDKEFKSIAFNLEEGQISEPFESNFGWHIIKLDKVRGEQLDVRHVLLIPKPTVKDISDAREKATLIRKRIMDKEISFENAVLEFSDDTKEKFNQEKLINPETLDTRFELTNLDANLYKQISVLKKGEITQPFLDENRAGKKFFKIFKLANRIEEHEANYKDDYNKIQELALKDLKLKEIRKWVAEKIQDTYISINRDNKNCDFSNNWLKQ